MYYYMYIYVHFRPPKSVVITSYKDSIVAVLHSIIFIQTTEYVTKYPNNVITPNIINL